MNLNNKGLNLMVESKNLLVLGANGFLGKNLVSKLNKTSNYDVYQLNGKNDLDLTKDNLFNNFLSKNKIDYIINCAAFVGGIAYGYDFPAELLMKNTIMASNIYKSAHENDIKSGQRIKS